MAVEGKVNLPVKGESKEMTYDQLRKITKDRMEEFQHEGQTFYIKHYYTADKRIVTLSLNCGNPSNEEKYIKRLPIQLFGDVRIGKSSMDMCNGTSIFQSTNVALKIGYSICVPDDDFDVVRGCRVASGRALKPRKTSHFISEEMSKTVFELFGKESTYETILNNAYTYFKKTKLKELNKRPDKK